MRTTLSSLLLAGLLLAPGKVIAQMQGSWNAEFDGDRVHLNIRTDLDFESGRRSGGSNYGRTIDASSISGLSRSGERMNFTLKRAAGTFTFEGRGNSDRASGSFEFEPNRTFATDLGKLGFRGVTDANLLVIALENMDQQGVRRLTELVVDDIDTDDLMKMINHGAGLDYVQDMNSLGFSKLSSSDYVRARDH